MLIGCQSARFGIRICASFLYENQILNKSSVDRSTRDREILASTLGVNAVIRSIVNSFASNESLSIRIVKTYLSKSESTYVLYNITLGTELRYLNRFYVENNVCGVFNLRFLSLQAMSLKKCRALIHCLFLG